MAGQQDGRSEEHEGTGTAVKRRGILAAAGAVVAGIVAKQASSPVAAANGDPVVLGSVSNAATAETGVLNSGPASPGGPAIHGFRSPGAVALVATTLNAGVVGQTFVTDAPGVMGSSPNGLQAKGVHGISNSGTGVFGSSTGGIGVSGSGDLTGVQGAINPASPAAQQTFAVIGRNSLNRPDAVGVLGTADHGVGVYGQTGAGLYGVRGDAGPAPGGAGLLGVSTVASGIAFGSVVVAPATTAGFFNGRTVVQGDLMVTGTKNCAVKDAAGEYRLLHCVEAPEAWFEDFGAGVLAGGRAEIALDPAFAQFVRTEGYHVFLSEHGEHNGLHTTRKGGDGFTVEASAKLAKAAGTSVAEASGTFSWRVVAKRKDAGGERLAKFALPHLAPPAVAPPIPGHPEPPAAAPPVGPESRKP